MSYGEKINYFSSVSGLKNELRRKNNEVFVSQNHVQTK